jgi:hypothetical protein
VDFLAFHILENADSAELDDIRRITIVALFENKVAGIVEFFFGATIRCKHPIPPIHLDGGGVYRAWRDDGKFAANTRYSASGI